MTVQDLFQLHVHKREHCSIHCIRVPAARLYLYSREQRDAFCLLPTLQGIEFSICEVAQQNEALCADQNQR